MDMKLAAARTALERFPSDRVLAPQGGEIEFFFFKHASFAIVYAGKAIYVDPLAEYAPYDELPKADVILITHSHYDHFDAGAVNALTGVMTETILNEESRGALGRGTVMHNGDRLQVGDWLGLRAVPAYNTTPGRDQFHPHNGRDNGYVLTLGGLMIYIAGDSEPTPEMLALRGMDIVFLPVNQPYTMTVDQAVETVRILRPQIFYPYHTGDTPVEQLAERLNGSGVEVRIFPME